MGRRPYTKRYFILIGLLLVVGFAGCKNPLVSLIDEEVEIAITPPEVATVYPEDKSTDVSISTNYISIDFSKTIAPATVTTSSIIIVNDAGVKLSGSWSVSGTTATFTPSGNLSHGSIYTVTITSSVLDTDGNPMSDEFSWSFTTGFAADSIPPVIDSVIVNEGAAWSSSLTVDIKINATDNNDTANVSAIAQMNINNSGWQPYASETSYTLSDGDGSRTVSVVVKDGSGNESIAENGSVNIDTTAPVIESFFLNGGQSATNTNLIDIEVFATDEDLSGIDSFRYRFPGGDWSSWLDLDADTGTGSVNNVQLAVSIGGTQTVEMQVRDKVGNLSSVESRGIIYETTPPAITDVNWDDSSYFPFNGSILRVTFNEEMNPSSVTENDFLLHDITEDLPVEGNIAFSSSDTVDNITVELWGLALDPNKGYRVTMKPTITDTAGNQMGGTDRIWYFNTGDAVDTEPPGGEVSLADRGVGATFATLPTGSIATDDYRLRIDLSAVEDDYNAVWGMKFWGDSDGSEASFESNAVWEDYSPTRDWNVSNSPGNKFILYKLVDSAGNESDSAGQIKIILDNAVPNAPTILLNDGDVYTNSSTAEVDLNFSASDDHSGVQDMIIGNDNVFTDSSWESWTPAKSGWDLTSGDGPKTVYFRVRDYLDQPSAIVSDTIIYDTTAPEIIFNSGLYRINSETQLLSGGGELFTVTETNEIDYVEWEVLSGPGTLVFNAGSGSGSANDGINTLEPYVNADTEGTYFIKLSAVDKAGNISTAQLPIAWDQTPPDDIISISVTESNPGYTTSAQPTWSWDDVSNADFYRVSPNSGFSVYEDVYTNEFSPNTALGEGSYTLFVKAMDEAGNSSSVISKSVSVDTISPTINVVSYQFVANEATPSVSLNFSDGTNGSVSDSGSGLDLYSWSKYSGPGTLSFTADDSNITDVSANADGDYVMLFEVTDAAGNTSSVQLSLLRDIVPPAAPSVTGPDITPSVRPIWYWSSGSDNVGVYQWNLDSSGWSAEASDTSYMPSFDLSGSTTGISHTLQVRVKDAADNWSDPGSWIVVVDTDATTPPSIGLNDGYPVIRSQNSVTWNAVSGMGGAATDYRYSIDSSAWVEVASSLSVIPTTPTVLPIQSGLSDGTHTIEIEERLDGSWRDDLAGSHTIVVDTAAPYPPNVTGSGYDTIHSDRTATNDTTPTWSWSSGGGGGSGVFRYEFNNSGTWVTTSATSYTSSSLSEATYILKVQERDLAGNWSSVAYHDITVDTTAPTISTVYLSGSTHPNDTDDTYTNSTTVTLDITGDISGETYPVSIKYYDYNPTGWKTWGSYFTGTATSISTTLTTTNGTKRVYAQLVDEAGNSSGYLNDTIILDTVAPSGSFTINGGATYTPSLSFNMTLSASDTYSDASEIEVALYSPYGEGWGSYRTYSASLTSDFQWPASTGSKNASVRFRDAAGNVSSSITDYITLQAPAMTYATKGESSTTVTINWNQVSSTAGTTYYYLYSTTNASANPNSDPGSVTYESLVSSGSSMTETLASNEKEQLRYYFVRAYNASTGGWGMFSTSSVLGFASNITIIYDSTDSVDTDTAEYIKTVLKSNPTVYSSVSGTMPSWTVTLLPEDLVSASYSSYNIIYGDPVIITPSAGDLYQDPDKVRNIVDGGHGIIGMAYYGGLRFIDVASDYWTSWGYPATASTDADQRPNEIGYGNSYNYYTGKYFMYTYQAGNSTWTTPLTSTSIPTSDEAQVQIGYDTATANERALYRATRTSPTRGYLYGRSQDSDVHFPVVRQGRFLYYGFDSMWTRPYTGWVYFINLVARMDNY